MMSVIYKKFVQFRLILYLVAIILDFHTSYYSST